jgi:hypothetical protein
LAFSRLKSADGDGCLVKIHFKALAAAGTSPLLFHDSNFRIGFINNLFDEKSILISCEWQDGAVTVNSP